MGCALGREGPRGRREARGGRARGGREQRGERGGEREGGQVPHVAPRVHLPAASRVIRGAQDTHGPPDFGEGGGRQRGGAGAHWRDRAHAPVAAEGRGVEQQRGVPRVDVPVREIPAARGSLEIQSAVRRVATV